MASRWTPPPFTLARVLDEQNPWHAAGAPPAAPAFERASVELLSRRLQALPRRFQLILGPRRVGKTTVMTQVVKRLLQQGIAPRKVWWLRLDHPVLMQEDLGALVRSAAAGATVDDPIYLLLDEVTYAHNWSLWLKTFYDENYPVRVIATSSATAAIRGRANESGVGRWEDQHLLPFSFLEYARFLTPAYSWRAIGSLFDDLCAESTLPATPEESVHYYMMMGGFPEILATPWDPEISSGAFLTAQNLLRGDAVEKAIYKDIPQAFGIDNPMMLERVLYVVASQISTVLAPQSTASNLGLSQPTLEKYLTYLSQTFLIFLLQNWSAQEEARQKRGRKPYFIDGAVRNAALQRGLMPMNDPGELGILRENLIASHLYALSLQSGTRVFYWRDGRHEVDFILDDGVAPIALEIASKPGHSRHGLHELAHRHPRFAGRCFVVSPGGSAVAPAATADGVGAVPFTTLLLVVAAHTEAATRRRLGGGAAIT
jgi:predicted AAA+ superfamily ATPase